jgi:hypothetical protein
MSFGLAAAKRIVSLEGQPMSSAALRFREFVAQAEAEVATFEEKVHARWTSQGATTEPTPRVSPKGKKAPRYGLRRRPIAKSSCRIPQGPAAARIAHRALLPCDLCGVEACTGWPPRCCCGPLWRHGWC